jgi:hypothetical protein
MMGSVGVTTVLETNKPASTHLEVIQLVQRAVEVAGTRQLGL